jgi:hypothetical protein
VVGLSEGVLRALAPSPGDSLLIKRWRFTGGVVGTCVEWETGREARAPFQPLPCLGDLGPTTAPRSHSPAQDPVAPNVAPLPGAVD